MLLLAIMVYLLFAFCSRAGEMLYLFICTDKLVCPSTGLLHITFICTTKTKVFFLQFLFIYSLLFFFFTFLSH